MTKWAIIIWWIEGLIAMISKRDLIGFCALLLAAHPQGVSDGYGRTMVGFIVLGGLLTLVGTAKRCRVRRRQQGGRKWGAASLLSSGVGPGWRVPDARRRW